MDILITVLLGVGVVFLGLLLILGLLVGLHKLGELYRKKRSKPVIVAAESGTDEPAPEMLVAILTAAIAAYNPEKAGKFRVVSFRKRPDENHR